MVDHLPPRINSTMKTPDSFSRDMPPGLTRPSPITDHQTGLFRITLADVIARLGVSHDDLRRWHDSGWLSFNENLNEELDEFGDPRILEIQIVRDIVRSGLSDAQIEVLLLNLPKPFAFNPDRIAYSFRHGWIQVEPPVEIPEPSEVIEEHIDDWIVNCGAATLEDLRDKIEEALKLCEENGAES
jgi:hypothetical protein